MAVGRPLLQYLKQVARNTEADSYTAMQRMACNNFQMEICQLIKILRDKKKIGNLVLKWVHTAAITKCEFWCLADRASQYIYISN